MPHRRQDMEADGEIGGGARKKFDLFIEDTCIVPGLWLLTPIFPSLFIVFKIWPMALALDVIVARSPRVPWTTDHRG